MSSSAYLPVFDWRLATVLPLTYYMTMQRHCPRNHDARRVAVHNLGILVLCAGLTRDDTAAVLYPKSRAACDLDADVVLAATSDGAELDDGVAGRKLYRDVSQSTGEKGLGNGLAASKKSTRCRNKISSKRAERRLSYHTKINRMPVPTQQTSFKGHEDVWKSSQSYHVVCDLDVKTVTKGLTREQ
ncbi:uncharacterized protein BT62DRAFT_1003530 [Guyanagaster necrorhizus]|uniref:Uncharacterized protein n=1 Tax=Guyanagaster necrorhizus TaxID=856835 RepID=A0A9P7VWZ9_9AGAR|nr:uncharacterized protein BT62DRAFT_1003530 [Guyanagaster necrorhizus MCA 3950]KAG7448813.1 hypothetical protein BT62DRAFT_1003530 [Guyanagaster necrorhizus MCA 3950]